MNRGSRVGSRMGAAHHVASMRPRFMNRGSGLPLAPRDVDRLASMRPRFMNRGSQKFAVNMAPKQQCFNEAPIHESGKSGRRGARSSADAALQ